MPDPIVAPEDSILKTMKKLLGIDMSDTVFDLDLILHINSVFSSLTQLSVGPDTSFSITGENEKWVDIIASQTNIQEIKTLTFFRLKLIFDPPSTSFAIDSIQKQIDKLEWLLNVTMEGVKHP